MTTSTVPAQAAAAVPSPAAVLTQASAALVPLLQQLGRQDLAQRVGAAAARVARPATVVCVVGEFKQGKSSLVNGILTSQVCPVDDDLATVVVTMVRYNETPVAGVRRRADGKSVLEEIAFETIGNYSTEAHNPDNAAGIERVEVGIPSNLLKAGLALVDTPGMGGLSSGHAAATLAFLPFADGLLFVSDATSELTAMEMDFLREAAGKCPTVMMVQTKTDIAPQWRKIVERNQAHLVHAGIDILIAPVSTALRNVAVERRDADLNQRSGYPELVQLMGGAVIEPARASALTRSASDMRVAVDLARSVLRAEKEMIDDPERSAEGMRALQETSARLEHLRGPGSQWRVVMGDRLADMTAKANHDFRAAVKRTTREVEEAIEKLHTAQGWEELSDYLQAKVAHDVSAVFVAIERDHQKLVEEILGVLADENLQLPDSRGSGEMIDVMTLWSAKPLEQESEGAVGMLRQGMNTVRGSSGGMSMFGMLGHYLPAASMAFLATNPVLLSVGAAFGALHLADERKRKLAARRQMARTQVRQFAEDVQFEVGDRIAQVMREIQRQLRDDFGERLTELQRSYTETIKAAQRSLEASASEAQARAAQLARTLDGLTAIDNALQGVMRG